MTPEFWITTAAIAVGPIIAVWVSQFLQKREKVRERQLNVLRALMSTRRTQLHADRIMALNMIDIEFSRNKIVLDRFRTLLKLYNETSRWKDEDADAKKKLFEDVDDASVRLIEAISRTLGYRYDNIDILRGGYYPDGLALQEEQQRIIREFFVGMRDGSLFLPVAVLDVRHPQEILDQARDAMAIMEAAKHDEPK